MDDELLGRMYHYLFHTGNAAAAGHVLYSDAVVALIYLFSTLNDRSGHWAHDKRHWPLWARRLAFPSYSQPMRRLPGVDPLVAPGSTPRSGPGCRRPASGTPTASRWSSSATPRTPTPAGARCPATGGPTGTSRTSWSAARAGPSTRPTSRP